jgi:hypothetical protein
LLALRDALQASAFDLVRRFFSGDAASEDLPIFGDELASQKQTARRA